MLTKREIEVLQLRKSGKTQQEVAKHLKISQPAVSTFERNAHRKINGAEELLKHLKDLGLLALALLFLPLLATQVSAANPGHAASRIAAGTFESGNYVFPAQLDVTGNLFVNTSKFFVNASSGSVGINRINPQVALDVNGSVIVGGALNVTTGPSYFNGGNTHFPGGNLELYGNGIYAVAGIETNDGDPTTVPYTFTGDTNTGMYRVGTDTIGFTAGGNRIVTINTTGLYVNTSQSLNTNSLCLSGTCIANWAGFTGNISGSGSTNYTARWTNGTHIAQGTIYDNGSFVGIGTALPQYILDVTGNSRVAGTLTVNLLNTGLGDYELYAMDQNLQTADSPSFARLTLTNNITIGAPNTASAGGTFRGGNSSEYQWVLTSGGFISSRDSGTQHLRADTYSNTTGAGNGPQLVLRRFGNASAWPTNVLSGWELGQLRAVGAYNNASATHLSGYITFLATEEFNSSQAGSKVALYTTPMGTASPLLAAEFSAGYSIINGSLRIENETGARVLLINSTTGVVRFGDWNSNVSLAVNGTINATGTITQNAGFDLAETFSAIEAMGSGDLVSVVSGTTVKRATRADADLVIGAVSTGAGFIIGDPRAVNPVLVGLAGRIPVRVSGTVSPGDFITPSDTPGVGERATRAGFVIGRAIEASNNGMVTIIIQPTYFNPSVRADGTIVGGSAEKAAFVDESLAGQAAKTIDPALIQQTVQQAVDQGVAQVQAQVEQQVQEAIANLPEPVNETNTTGFSGDTLEANIITPQSGNDVIIQLG